MMRRYSGFIILIVGLLCLPSLSYSSNLGFDVRDNLQIIELDGTPSTFGVHKIFVSNDSMTVSGDSGVITLSLPSDVAPDNATYITQTSNASLTAEQALDGLASGLLSNDTSAGVLTTVANTKGDIYTSNGTDLVLVAVGTNGQMLSADSGTASGISWVTNPTINAFLPLGSGLLSNDTATGILKSIDQVKGDVYVSDGTNLVRLAIGANGRILSADSTTASGLAWAVVSQGTGNPAGADKQVQFNSGGSSFGADSTFTFDTANNTVSADIVQLSDSLRFADNVVSADISFSGVLTISGQTHIIGAFIASADTVADGATITIDAELGNFFTVTLGGNRTLATMTGGRVGQRLIVRVSQDSTGTRLLTYGANIQFGKDVTSPTLSTTGGCIDYLGFFYNGVSWDVTAVAKGYPGGPGLAC